MPPRGRKPDPNSKTQRESERLYRNELHFWRHASVAPGIEPGTAVVTSPGGPARTVPLPIVCSPTTKLHSASVRRRLAIELLPEQHRLREQYKDRVNPERIVARDAPKLAKLRDALQRSVKAKDIDEDGLNALDSMEREIESMPPSLTVALRQVREAGRLLTDRAVVAMAGRHLAAAVKEYWRKAEGALDGD